MNAVLRSTYAVLNLIIMLMLALLFFLISMPFLHLYLNESASMPKGVYQRVHKDLTRIQRGDLVRICLNEEQAFFAVQRSYLRVQWLPTGCPQRLSPLVKSVAAVSGDVVEVTPAGVLVNQRLIPHSRLIAQDAQARLMPFPGHAWRLTEGELFLLATFSPYSLDSRYYGAIKTSQVRDVVRPVFLLNH